MGLIKEIVTPCFTITDSFVVLAAWGATHDTGKTLIIGLVWFTIEAIIRVKIRNNEVKTILKQKVEVIKQEDNKIVE